MAIKTFLSSVGVCWLRLNPIAIRKAKIAYNYKLHTIFAFQSAVGLKK